MLSRGFFLRAMIGCLIVTAIVGAGLVFVQNWDVIGRFMHMQVDLYSFISALNGILAQRLLRLNCPHCVEPYVPDDEALADSGLTRAAVAGYKFQIGRGCGQCRGTGYRGRKAIAELMVLDDELRELIGKRVPTRRLLLPASPV